MRTIDTLASRAPERSTYGRQAEAGFGPRLVMVLNSVLHTVSLALERRRSRMALLELTDDMLKDIGLSRADAEREGMRRPWQQ
jgi:uncharacterized protein YjiS (DUF1127 family)